MTFFLIFVALAYIAVLFWLANWGDKTSAKASKITRHPFVYSLALGIYCTSWTFYGAVGTAANNGWSYLPILLGPALLFIFGQGFLHKLVVVSKKQNITTIADFISSRYGKRQFTAILVTVIALLATIPYIALQLKALSTSFVLLQSSSGISGPLLAFIGTLMMALFAIFFGTRKVDVTEYRSGLMLAIAFESFIKLIALIAVAGLAIYIFSDYQPGMMAFFQSQDAFDHWQRSDFFSFTFIGQALMAAAAIICLPRQFHVTVIDNQDPKHLKTARWAFPLYLLLTAAVIIPIATAAMHPLIGGEFAPDSFVLALPLAHGFDVIAILVFVGGLSAATAMIVVATLTLSTMISNDVVLPLMLRRKFRRNLITTSYKKRILLVRRLTIALILFLSYFYQQMVGDQSALASMGLVAFSLVTQLLPAIVGGLYWRKGHAYGVYAGLMAGILCWMLFLMLPMLEGVPAGEYVSQQSIITQGTFIALFANIICYISFSLGAHERLVDKIQASAFVNPRASENSAKRATKRINANIYDLKVLLQTFLGIERAKQILIEYAMMHEMGDDNSTPSINFVEYCERSLAGVLGASTARAIMGAVISGKQMAFEEVVNFFDETTQALQFNQNLLYTALENLSHGISVVDKDLKLVAWNKRYIEMFEYPENFLESGQPIEEVIRFNVNKGDCGPGEFEDQVQKRVQHLKNGTPHHFTRKRRNGKVFEMIGNPLPDGGFVTCFSDVTNHINTQDALEEVNIDLENRIEVRTQQIRSINKNLEAQIVKREQTEQALQQAKMEAEKANESKTRFLALASHDILQPLNAARLYLAAIDEAQLNAPNKSALDKLGDSLDSTVHLMSALLEIAKLDQGAMTPTPRHFSISDILQPLSNEYSILSKAKGLLLKIKECDTVVHSDTTYLRRIIQNLVSNAVKYTQTGKVLVLCRKRGLHLRIEVWDTGPGISEYEQQRIFNDFYRISKTDNKGVGLGLGVVKRMADLLSIPLSLTSVVGKGSCFSIEVPLGEPALVQQKPSNSSQLSQDKTLTIFMVDDEQENLAAMSTLLDKWFVKYNSADNVDDAFTYAHTHCAPDVILMDYQLSNECDGVSLISQLRDIWHKQVPSILITAVRDDSLKQQVKELNIHYLSKPIKPAKLKALLNHNSRL
ncbi:PAS domain-containing hybrid sensor histidine kinase/response regulator [Pseudoalteromonas ulvae]|uniref:histidine kinase n=1 Tax=Pseudoalteromonas ulvae TaxID=107327 RepID=A0A244CTW2_PSEDV|nr:PAS domain-containing hybrid sensor histidine kinase/response regulator [Pseudoalteromonas ulvae]OUL59038.1 hybrid sensor histidine kinase/response regulator [Pseudoalteromonas ulvae]